MLICGNSFVCTGCRICEAMCSLNHFSIISPSRGRIQIKREDLGADRIFVCQQCEDPECVAACPEGALWREDHYVKFDRDLCVGCFACVEACPYEGIWTHPDLDYPLKCDLCDGTPLCVDTCPADVLKLVDTEEAAEKIRNEFIPGQALVQAYIKTERDQSE